MTQVPREAELPQRLRRLLEGFRLVEDRAERIQLLIDIADRYHDVPERIARRPYPADRLVPHCESEVYFWAEDKAGGGTLELHFAVENPQGISARALAVVLDETLSGEPLDRVVEVPGDFPYEIFGRELSMGKTLGLTAMVGMVKAAARQRITARVEPGGAQRK